MFTAPLCSALCRQFSCRWVVFTGGILCWLGVSLSYFTTSLVQLCFTFGVLTGNYNCFENVLIPRCLRDKIDNSIQLI
jgi:hypothetical protein